MPKRTPDAKKAARAALAQRRARRRQQQQQQQQQQQPPAAGGGQQHQKELETPEPEPEPLEPPLAAATGRIGGEATAVAAVVRKVDSEAILYPRVLAPSVCADLIRMSRGREFSLDPEHVDDGPLYQIDLVQHGWVADSGMWSVVGPLFDQKLKPLLAELPWLKGSAFTLDFAFLKRYRLDERTHLGVHLDSSFFTFNILLSDPASFEGGDIYIFTPLRTQQHSARHESMSTQQKAAWIDAQQGQLPVVAGYSCGDVLAFTGDRHLHGTLPVTGGERAVMTFFFDKLTEQEMGRWCVVCGEWRERYEFSKKQLRQGDDATCKVCTDNSLSHCLTCAQSCESHLGGCCHGDTELKSGGGHRGSDRRQPRPVGVISFPS
jgi:hypothetical protein